MALGLQPGQAIGDGRSGQPGRARAAGRPRRRRRRAAVDGQPARAAVHLRGAGGPQPAPRRGRPHPVRPGRAQGRVGLQRPHRQRGELRRGADGQPRPARRCAGAHPRPTCTARPTWRWPRWWRSRSDERSGRGQLVDVSAQVSCLQASFCYSLNEAWHAPPMHRAGEGLDFGAYRIRWTYPAADGEVSITVSFGAALAEFMDNLFAWIWEEGGCDEATRDTLLGGPGRAAHGRRRCPPPRRTGTATSSPPSRRRGRRRTSPSEARRRRVLLAPVATLHRGDGERPPRRPGLLGRRRPPRGRPGRTATRAASWCRRPRRSRPSAAAPGLGADDADQAAPRHPAAGAAPLAPTSAARSITDASGDGRGPALAGLKVLDLAWSVAGPLVGRTLADFGATVVRIDTHTRIDVARAAPPFHPDHARFPNEGSGLHANTNAGKLSLELDLSTAGGARRLLRPRPLGGRRRRELLGRHAGPHGPRLRRAGGGQPGCHPAVELPARPDRHAGDARARQPHHRAVRLHRHLPLAGPAGGRSLRRLHRRHLAPLRPRRRAGGAGAPAPHRPGPAPRPVAGRGLAAPAVHRPARRRGQRARLRGPRQPRPGHGPPRRLPGRGRRPLDRHRLHRRRGLAAARGAPRPGRRPDAAEPGRWRSAWPARTSSTPASPHWTAGRDPVELQEELQAHRRRRPPGAEQRRVPGRSRSSLTAATT